jgi:monoamine oxidase
VRSVVSIALAQFRIDRMAKKLPIDAPWTAKRANEWDARSVQWWMDNSRVRKGIGYDLFEMAVRGLMTGDLNEASFLHLLTLIRGHGASRPSSRSRTARRTAWSRGAQDRSRDASLTSWVTPCGSTRRCARSRNGTITSKWRAKPSS